MKKVYPLLFLGMMTLCSSAQIGFKNSGWNRLLVAICYHDKSGGWITKGWYPIEPDEEKVIFNYGINTTPKFYYYAVVDSCDKEYSGDKYMYVEPGKTFRLSNADHPETVDGKVYKKCGFVKVDLDNKRNVTVDIRPVNIMCYGKKQGKWRLPMDKEGHEAVLKEDAVCYREITFRSGRPIGWSKDYYLDGTLKGEFKLVGDEPFLYDGKCTWYNKDGSVSKEDIYMRGIVMNGKDFGSHNVPEVIKQRYQVIKLPIQEMYINSTSNEFWKGGNSKTVFMPILPKNTVEWYYEFTVSKNPADVIANQSQFSAASKLTSLLEQTGSISDAINVLETPPGNNNCNIYLIEGKYLNSFNKWDKDWRYYVQYSRLNYKAGVVQVKGVSIQQPFIGVKNNDVYDGIHVSIQVVAIVSVME